MKLQLFTNECEILATDGLLFVDGRLNIFNIKQEVRKRNARYLKNFPHKIATAFAIYNGRNLGKKITL